MTIKRLPDDEARKRLTEAYEWVFKLAKTGGRAHRMTVPAEDTDTDMALVAGLEVGEKLLAERRAWEKAE